MNIPSSKYYILTNQQLNLASAFERFQMARFGNVLVVPDGIQPIENTQDNDKWLFDQMEKIRRQEEKLFGY